MTDGELREDLPSIAAAFGLGGIGSVRYLADGLMNRNWQVESVRGVYALKRIVDVSVATARRNLSILSLLAEQDVAALPPLAGPGGDSVVEVGGRGYCLFPWVQGSHVHGTELSVEQARQLGTSLGRLHRALNTPPVTAHLPDKPVVVHAKVADPASAAAEVDRFLGVIAGLKSPGPFDDQVTGWLEQRKVLLDKYAHLRPGDEAPRGPFGWTHGDFQHLNVLWRDGEVAAVLDWDRIRVRPFGEEVARSATLLFGRTRGDLDLERVSAFTDGYRRQVPLTDDDLADAVDRLWWKRMCDFWHLEFHYDRADHGCDHLFFSASRFLEWWTGHRVEVQRAFAAAP
jgi:Ser/Thr protein kinase RdoA (MazF antagonist)